MAKITRFNGNLQAFASEATGQERTIFGVETQADDLTSQIGALFRRGWGIVSPTDAPKLQDFNALGYTTTQLLAYLHQVGVPEWNGSQDFYTGSATLHSGRVWIAQVNEPTDEPGTSAQWETLLNLSDASVAATPGQMVKRGETGSTDEGTAEFAEPTKAQHPARKQELDTHVQSTTAHMASAIVHNPAENSFDSTDTQGALNEASGRLATVEDVLFTEQVASTVSWNQATDTWTGEPRATDAHTAMRRCVVNSAGVVQYYLDEFDSTLQEDGVTPAVLDGTDGQVMVEVPQFYVRTQFNGHVTTWSVSPVPLTGYTLHPAFSGGVKKFYAGAYDTVVRQSSTNTTIDGLNLDNNTGRVNLAADELWSASGNFPMVGLTRAEFRILAENTGMQLYDFWQWQAVMMLFITEYGSWNSQAVLGRGNVDRIYLASSSNQADSPHVAAGLSNGIGNGSGGIDDADGNPWVSYRGIENPWGNCWNWLDGWNIDNRQSYVSNDETTYADDTTANYTVIGDALPTASDSPIKNWQYVENTFLVRQVDDGASTSAFVTDHFWTNTGWRVARVGGDADDDLRAGLACCFLDSDSANRIRSRGARLSKKIRS